MSRARTACRTGRRYQWGAETGGKGEIRPSSGRPGEEPKEEASVIGNLLHGAGLLVGWRSMLSVFAMWSASQRPALIHAESAKKIRLFGSGSTSFEKSPVIFCDLEREWQEKRGRREVVDRSGADGC